MPEITAVPSQEILRFRGDSAALTIPLYHPDTGAAYDPSASGPLLFTMKASADDLDTAAIVQKLSNAGAMTLANPTVVTLVADDAALISAQKTYLFDVLDTATNRTVAQGTFWTEQRLSLTGALAIATNVIDPAAPYLDAATIAANAAAAEDWARKTDGIVESTDYSAKEFAQGTQPATGGSAKNWAAQTGADVTGAATNDRSAKSWAQEAIPGATLGGSAKDWAQSDSKPDGVNESAKTYAGAAAADVVLTDADVVLTHADVVLTHADVVSTHVDAATTAAFAAGNTVLFSHYADAGNVTTGETDLYSDSIPGTVFNADGTALRAEYGLALVGSTSTKKVKAYFGGTAIFDTGALTVTTAGGLQIAIVLIRAGSSSVRYEVSATGTNTGTLAFSATGTVTGLTLTAAQILKLTGTAASTGAATNDIVAKLARAATASDNGAGLATYVANNKNALAPRGGLAFAFNGTTPVRITGPLGLVGTVGTDPFSDVLFCSVPTANPATGQLLFQLHSGTVGFVASVVFASINTSGGLDIIFIDSSTTNSRVATVANFVSSYGGKVVMVAIVRSATGLLIYINGVSVAFAETPTGSPASFATMSVAAGSSAGYTIGSYDGATVYVGTLSSFSHYNLALAASDVLEIYERNGGVPERFKWGSQLNVISNPTNDSTFDGVTTGWAASGTPTITLNTTTHALDFVTAVATYGCRIGSVPGTTSLITPFVPGTKFRLIGELSNVVGTTIEVGLTSGSGFDTGLAGLGNGPFDTTVASRFTGPNGYFGIRATAPGSFTLDNAIYKKLGAVIHLPLTDGAGFQPKDASSNALHGALTATGISHTLPAPIGTRIGYVGTFHHTDISAVSGTTVVGIWPPGWAVVDFQVNFTAAFDAGCTISFGSSGTPGRYVNAMAADVTGLKQATPLVLTPPSLTASTTLYITKSTTTTVGDLVTCNVVLERKY